MTTEMWDTIKEKYCDIFDDPYHFITDLYEDPDREVETYLKRREH